MPKIKKQTGSTKALVLATLILAINFWAWSLLGPLATKFADELTLSSVQVSGLVAIPVIIGSIGRIFLGALTDKYGGKKVFVTVCFLISLPVFGLAFADSYTQLLILGFALGLAGATFSVGIPFVNAWFPPNKRGLALGIYGMGNLGVAISGFITPRLVSNLGNQLAFFVVGVILIFAGIIALLALRDSKEWHRSNASFTASLRQAIKLGTTKNLALIYMLSFGAFVAFGLYLPVLLKTVYNLELTDAASRAAGFVIVATLARPVGGWLCDKINGATVIKFALLIIVILGGLLTFQQPLGILVTIQYLSLALFLGITNGAVFAQTSRLTPPKLLGSVAGIVGAAGSLGGLLPPLIMGLSYQYTQSYAYALGLFSITALLILVYINSSRSHIR
jgi:NNP family nitrate/nitrite transporter-like MFS transporter